MYALFFMMGLGVLVGLVVVPVVTAPLVPWWGTVLMILGELVFLRYTAIRILGMMFAIFVSVGLRIGTMAMRGAKVEVHGVRVVPKPERAGVPKVNTGSVDETEHEAAYNQPDAEGTRYVKVECTVRPAEGAAGPMRHYEPWSFKLSTEGLALPKFPPRDDERKTGELFAAAEVMDGVSTPLPLDEQLVGPRRLELVFRCPPTLKGRAKLKFVVLKLADIDLPAS